MKIFPGQTRVGWMKKAMFCGMAAMGCLTETVFAQEGIALINVSTRGTAGAGDNVMIAGFIIEGTMPRTVAIRVLGPTLSTFGLTGVLADPNCTLISGATEIGKSDNWRSDATSAAALTGSQLAPLSDKEPGLVRTLAPGNYTVVVRGAGSQVGVALIEVYDLDAKGGEVSGSRRVINLSTRGYVGSGENVMIMGFIIGGTTPRDVLITTIAGSLPEFGVSSVLVDPKVEIFSNNQKITESDDWIDSPHFDTIARTGYCPRNPLESAVWARLNPGAYTAVISGVNGTQGVALPEVYDIRALRNIRFSPVAVGDVKAKLSVSSGAPPQVLDINFVGASAATVNGGAAGTFAYSATDDFRGTITVDASGYVLTGRLKFYREGYAIYEGTLRASGGAVQNVGGVFAFQAP